MSGVDVTLVNSVLLGLTGSDELSTQEREEVTRELIRRGWISDESALRFGNESAGVPYFPKPDEPQCLGDKRFTKLPASPDLLAVCARCRCHEACEKVTRPREGFDGVCAGVVYQNGRPVRGGGR